MILLDLFAIYFGFRFRKITQELPFQVLQSSLASLILFSVALCDGHTPRATSPAAFFHNSAEFYQNSNFDITGAWTEESPVLIII